MLRENINNLYQNSFKTYWDSPALSNYEGVTYTYGEMATQIALWHLLWEQCGIVKGDRIALLAKDSAEWGIIFMASVTYGAVIVPILQDFTIEDTATILAHSESRILFTTTEIWSRLASTTLPHLDAVLDIQSHQHLYLGEKATSWAEAMDKLQQSFAYRYPKGYLPQDISYYQPQESEMLLLNYTSGTTGYSKGVMVSAGNMAGNVLFCIDNNIINPGEHILCFLPLAHTYSCMIHLQLAMAHGIHITILGLRPSPQILRKALGVVRPPVVVTVPLVLEKIYASSIQPLLSTPKIKLLLSLPVVRTVLYRKIRKKLLEGLGGNAREVISGGAALNPEVASFLKRIGFPLTVGYGMTECDPLISYATPQEWKLGSCGRPLQGYMQARIAPLDEEDAPQHYHHGDFLVGEIQVQGTNTCLGYYKDPEQTALLFTEDGWLRTGDLGSMDSDGFLYIKGRSKTMLLGPSGQNIYPEELEAKISLLPYVQECIVVMRKTQLVAIIVPNEAQIQADGLNLETAWTRISSQRSAINAQLAGYEQIQSFELRTSPFEKTPKQSIKRFLYH